MSDDTPPSDPPALLGGSDAEHAGEAGPRGVEAFEMKRRGDVALADDKADASDDDLVLVRPGKTHWALSGFLSVGMIMGTGILALPQAMAGTGYVFGSLLCVCFGILAGYMGMFLGETRRRFYPRAGSYAALATAVLGPRFGRATHRVLLAYWWGLTSMYVVSTVDALRNAFYASNLCYTSWGIIVCALILLPTQVRNFHDISWPVVVSDIAVIIVVALVLGALGHSGQRVPSDFNHSIGAPAYQGFLRSYNPVSTFIFAYSGQSIFLEIQTEMRSQRDFPKAVWLGIGLLIPSFLVTAIVGYYLRGDTVAGFLPASIPDGPVKTLANLLLAYHTIVAYVIHVQPLSHGVAAIFDPLLADRPRHQVPRTTHFAVSVMLLSASYVCTNLVPFFADFVSILGAMFGTLTTFFFPSLMWIIANRSRGNTLSRLESTLSYGALCVVFPITFIVGTVAAFAQLIESWDDEGMPFECHVAKA